MSSKKTAVITGADGGMGTEITKAVASEGYHVVMACRDQDKGEERKSQILEAHPDSSLEVMPLDLGSFASVASFADRLEARGEPINLQMNNAGMLATGFEQTEDGLERTVQVNYAGHYLLTRRLVPLMSEGSRIVNMVSCTHSIGKISFPEFFTHGRKGGFWRIPIYSNTKFAFLLFTFELADRLRERGITVNAADPGIVSTNIISMDMWFDPLADIFFRPFIRKPRKGASTAIDLLLKDDFSACSGNLCASNKIKKISDKYRNHPLRKPLWEETEKRVGKYLKD